MEIIHHPKRNCFFLRANSMNLEFVAICPHSAPFSSTSLTPSFGYLESSRRVLPTILLLSLDAAPRCSLVSPGQPQDYGVTTAIPVAFNSACGHGKQRLFLHSIADW